MATTSMPMPSVFAPGPTQRPLPAPVPPRLLQPHPGNLGWLHLPLVPPGADPVAHAHAVYASVLNHLLALRPARHPRDSSPFTALHELALCPNPNARDQYYSKVSKPVSLRVIEHNVHSKGYTSPAAFETDILQVFANARLANKVGTQAYSQVVRLQHVYLELVNWPHASSLEAVEAHMDAVVRLASTQPVPFSSVPIGPGETSYKEVNDGPNNVSFTCTADAISSARLHNREKIVLDHAQYKGQTYRVGDWVHVINPTNPAKPVVGQIFKVMQKAPASSMSNTRSSPSSPSMVPSSNKALPNETGPIYVSVCWYYRPEDTVHAASRHFIKNEVFKTGLTVDHKVQDIVERCYVMFYTRFIRGRPTSAVWNPETERLYVSEFRYNDLTRQFNKIKSWNSCIPEELRGSEVPMDAFPKPILPEREPSPFVTGAADGPGFLGPEGICSSSPPQMNKQPHALHQSTLKQRKRPAADPLMDMRPTKEAATRSRRAAPPPPPPLFMPGGGLNFLPPVSSAHSMVMLPPSQHTSLPMTMHTPVGLSPSPPMADLTYRPASAGGLSMGMEVGFPFPQTAHSQPGAPEQPQLLSPSEMMPRVTKSRSQTLHDPATPVHTVPSNNGWLTAPVQRVRHSSVPIDADRTDFLSSLSIQPVSTPSPSFATAPVSPIEAPLPFFSWPGPQGPTPKLVMTPPSTGAPPARSVPASSRPGQTSSQGQNPQIPELTFDSLTAPSSSPSLADLSSSSSVSSTSSWNGPMTPIPATTMPYISGPGVSMPMSVPSTFSTQDAGLLPPAPCTPTPGAALAMPWSSASCDGLITVCPTDPPSPAAPAVLRRASFDMSHSLAASLKDKSAPAANQESNTNDDGTSCELFMGPVPAPVMDTVGACSDPAPEQEGPNASQDSKAVCPKSHTGTAAPKVVSPTESSLSNWDRAAPSAGVAFSPLEKFFPLPSDSYAPSNSSTEGNSTSTPTLLFSPLDKLFPGWQDAEQELVCSN